MQVALLPLETLVVNVALQILLFDLNGPCLGRIVPFDPLLDFELLLLRDLLFVFLRERCGDLISYHGLEHRSGDLFLLGDQGFFSFDLLAFFHLVQSFPFLIFPFLLDNPVDFGLLSPLLGLLTPFDSLLLLHLCEPLIGLCHTATEPFLVLSDRLAPRLHRLADLGLLLLAELLASLELVLSCLFNSSLSLHCLFLFLASLRLDLLPLLLLARFNRLQALLLLLLLQSLLGQQVVSLFFLL